MTTRRDILTGCGAALLVTSGSALALDSNLIGSGLFNGAFSGIPDYSRFLTLAETNTRMNEMLAAFPSLIKKRAIGESRAGMPISMFTLAGGERSALVVAGVHANEVAGSITAVEMLNLLAEDKTLRESLGYTWHFINPIDPDGMKLNESWIGADLTPESYLRGFYRPAFVHQPEYTFPMDVGDFSFDDSPPENLAFQNAIDLAAPDFLYTLHNSEFGGAFFLTSRGEPALEEQLAKLPEKFELPLDEMGETISNIPKRSPGIFAMPQPTEMVSSMQKAGIDPRAAWPAGDVSTSYAKKYGTFAFVAEVPYWCEAGVYDSQPSDISQSTIIGDYVEKIGAFSEILNHWLPKIEPTEENFRFKVSLDEYANQFKSLVPRLIEVATAPDNGPKLTRGEALTLKTSLHLFSLRPIATLARAALVTGGLDDAYANAMGLLDRHITDIKSYATLRNVPIKKIAGVQAVGGLLAAKLASRSN